MLRDIAHYTMRGVAPVIVGVYLPFAVVAIFAWEVVKTAYADLTTAYERYPEARS